MKLHVFDSSYFSGKGHIKDEVTQNYLDFKEVANSDGNSGWKSKVLFDESIKPSATSNNVIAPSLNYISNKLRVKLDGSYLKQEK